MHHLDDDFGESIPLDNQKFLKQSESEVDAGHTRTPVLTKKTGVFQWAASTPPGTRLPLHEHKERYIIGRLPDNNIRIDNSAVSGHHSLIILDDSYAAEFCRAFPAFLERKDVEFKSEIPELLRDFEIEESSLER
jgi:hypothetical protein